MMISLEQAILLASEVCNGKIDKLGNPAIFHQAMVLLLAQKMTRDTRTHIIAVLHDIVQYTEFDSVYKKLGDRDLEDAFRAITQKQNEPYRQYLMRVSCNNIARNVKMLDLIYNLSKVSDRSEYAELAEKYRDGIRYLNKRPLEIRPVEYSRGNYSYRVNRRG
jgi:hypothetical protein